MKTTDLMLSLKEIMQDNDISDYEIFANASFDNVQMDPCSAVFCQTKIGKVVVLHDRKEIYFVEE